MKTAGWKSVAWDGVRFAVPREWEPARIGQRYLLFESAAGPSLEIKWGSPGRGLSSQRQLRQLSRQVGREGGVFRERRLPGGGDRLGAIDAVGFEWKSREQAAVGALLSCAVCRTTSLMQFFRHEAGDDIERQAAHVLRSFRDHRSDGRSAWALYDVCAVLPGHFRMTAHRFDAGRFVLEFSGQRQRLALYRWAPASVLLERSDLFTFAGQFAGGAGIEFFPLAEAGLPAVEGMDRRPDGLAVRWREVFSRPWYRGVRVWHLHRRNRILGVRLEARQPLTTADLTEVCSGYGLDDEAEKQAALESV